MRQPVEVRRQSDPLTVSSTAGVRLALDRQNISRELPTLHGCPSAGASSPLCERHTTPSCRRLKRQQGAHRLGSSRKSSKGSVAAALARHVQSEAARAHSAEKTRSAVERCPMLARHLHYEAAVRQAATTAVPHLDIETVAADIRATPRHERRSRLAELPKATRAALEQHLVAEKAAADASSICSTSAGATADGFTELDPSHCSGSIGNSSLSQV